MKGEPVDAVQDERPVSQRHADVDRLAMLLHDTRPDDSGTEGEWALRLYEAGVRPPAPVNWRTGV